MWVPWRRKGVFPVTKQGQSLSEVCHGRVRSSPRHSKNKRLSHYMFSRVQVTVDGFRFTEHVQIVTRTSNYSAVANSHTLQVTTERTKSSQSALFTSHCLVTASNAGASSASVFMPLLASDCPTRKFWTCPAYNTSARTAHGTPPNSSPFVASHSCRTDHVGNTASQLVHLCRLGIFCLAAGVVYRVITWQRICMLPYRF
jgi:hypothetical protein